MRVVGIGSGLTRQSPLPGGPIVEVLISEEAGAGQLAVAHLTLRPGGGMAEHAHGESTTLLVPLDGELLIHSGGREEKVTSGVVVLLGQRERASLANETTQPVSLLAVFAPAGFVRALDRWPAGTEVGAQDGA